MTRSIYLYQCGKLYEFDLELHPRTEHGDDPDYDLSFFGVFQDASSS